MPIREPMESGERHRSFMNDLFLLTMSPSTLVRLPTLPEVVPVVAHLVGDFKFDCVIELLSLFLLKSNLKVLTGSPTVCCALSGFLSFYCLSSIYSSMNFSESCLLREVSFNFIYFSSFDTSYFNFFYDFDSLFF